MSFLEPHPYTPCRLIKTVEVCATLSPEGVLTVMYRLHGVIPELRVPRSGPPRREEGLWRHTCFEVFVMGADAPAYREFNFSPSGAWQAYGFSAYRQGGPVQDEVAPAIECTVADACLVLQARIPAAALPAGGQWFLGLDAVIEDGVGALSYWSLRHPPGKPDFHDTRGFIFELQRP